MIQPARSANSKSLLRELELQHLKKSIKSRK
jgi:hypothetical protein